jgi:hypothetical protein
MSNGEVGRNVLAGVVREAAPNLTRLNVRKPQVDVRKDRSRRIGNGAENGRLLTESQEGKAKQDHKRDA